MKSNSAKSGKALTLLILILVVAVIFFGFGFAAGFSVGYGRNEPVTVAQTDPVFVKDEVTEEETNEEEVPDESIEEETVVEGEDVDEPDEVEDEIIEYDETKLSWWIKLNAEHKTPQITDKIMETVNKYNAVYVGDTSEKSVYLTFDEGYEMGYTSKILDVLKENEVSSIFFVTGPYIEKNPELVQRMIDEGHVIGNHTISHPPLPDLSDEKFKEEITGLDERIFDKFGVRTRHMRPPSGYYSEKTLKMTEQLGFMTVFWSFAYDDWHTDLIRGPDYAYDIVMKNLHNGGIFLLHAVSKDNADALDRIIKGIRDEGYEIKPFDF